MNRSFEGFDESEIPIEDSIKSIRLSISHQHDNVLISSKDRVKQEAFVEFGIHTAPDYHIEDIEWNNFKDLISSYQPYCWAGHQRLITAAENYWTINKPKRQSNSRRQVWMNSTKVSSTKILELLFPKKALN